MPVGRALVLAGPTAAGKTEAALAVAERFDAEVLSADAMQVYRGLDIGTAKASPAERARVPHHAIDVVDPHESFDAADFCALGDALIASGARVVITGGTALYIRSLVRGLVRTPPVDQDLRAELAMLADPHAALAEVDPVLAGRLHPNDRVRVLRGLEVARQLGRPLSAIQAEHAAQPDRLHVAALWLDRPDLEERIAQRLGAMMGEGYLGEVQGLLDAGVSRDAKPMRSLGYRHLADHLSGEIDLDEALRSIRRDTWQLARKQRNWMRQLGYRRIESEHIDHAMRAAGELWPHAATTT